ILNRALHLKAIFIPLFAGTVRKAENLAWAMESRGYDGRRRRTSFKPLAWNKNDWLTMGVIFLAFLGSFLLDKWVAV
ncbi:MAG: CbiQ family ECF transporter T component, partial [bacterium]